MTIGIVARQFPVVSETFILDHVTGLIERGRDVEVFCRALVHGVPPLGEALRARIQEWLPDDSARGKLCAGLAVAATTPPLSLLHGAALGLGGLPKDTWALGHALRARLERHDLVHAHFGPTGEQLAFLKRAGVIRVPLVVSLHGYDVTMNIEALRRCYRFLFDCADRIVVTTGFMADRAVALGCPEHKILRNPIGIRLDRFECRPRIWRPSAPLRVLSTARLVEKKGIEYALRAIARLAAQHVRIEYRIAGDGPLRPRLEALAADLGIAPCVRFLGALPHAAIAQELDSCDVFVFPSVTAADGDQEGQGMALIEAQACGIPCIASRSGGIPEVLQDGINGYLVPERDSEAIAQALQRLLGRHAEWPAMTLAGRRWVEGQFDLKRHLDALDQLYLELKATAA